CAQVSNSSFESGLNGWTVAQAVTVLGPPSQSATGTDGSHAANIGAYDAVGSSVSQIVSVSPGTSYVLSFDTGANGVNTPGLVSALQALVQAGNQTLGSLTVTDISPAFVSGSSGFTRRILNFQTPTNASSVTIGFFDQSPNNGAGVDAMLDNV